MINRLKREEAAKPAPEPTKSEVFLEEIRDLLKRTARPEQPAGPQRTRRIDFWPVCGEAFFLSVMASSVLKFLFICLEVILLFNLLILVHELGHFLAARWRGLVVEKFAIWFGKPIWSKKIKGVEYRLGSIPAGGYVAIPQLAPMEAFEGRVETDRSQLPPVKPMDKIIVAAAGPCL